ncbi:MAG: SEL1-like repeat protein [Bacteroidetes bacterium]|nr:SEL1-like repeat protein [Fibrella sp.]
MIGSKVFDYEITRKIKAGGMGVVFEGRRTWGRHEPVAIKFLLENLRDDPRIRQRFLREAEILETLRHSSIVRILGLDAERDAFIMEFVDGPTLADYLSHHPRGFHDPEKAVAFFSQILTAFNYAHHTTVEIGGKMLQGVIHRDIKPGNIIIQPNDAPKVLDFGISRVAAFGSTLTDPNLQMGSIAYMSPEQIVDPANVDWRSDIYALGVNLWELFAGQSPYPRVTSFEKAVEVQNHIRREALPPLTEVISDLSPDMQVFLRRVQPIIAKATAKDAADRYQSCEEMSVALQATLLPEPEIPLPTPSSPVMDTPVMDDDSDEPHTIFQRSPSSMSSLGPVVPLAPEPVPVTDKTDPGSAPVLTAAADQTSPGSNLTGTTPPTPTPVIPTPSDLPVPSPSDTLPGTINKQPADLPGTGNRPPQPREATSRPPYKRLLVVYASLAVATVMAIGYFWSQSVTSTQAADDAVQKSALTAKAVRQKAFADSCYQVGQNYYSGQSGVEQDYKKAAEWYNRAAKSGSASGQNDLGYMYQLGLGVVQNDTIATLWYRRAAEQGEADAQNSLGNMYANGFGVKQDYEQAVQWYQKAADQDNAKGQNNLGTMYYLGHSVSVDKTKAASLYRKAADQGNKEAQYNIGLMYETGEGVALDLNKARQWYRVAAKQGNPDARRALREMR